MKVGRFVKDASMAKLKFEYSFVLTLGTTTHISGFSFVGNACQPSVAAINGASLTPASLTSTPYGFPTLAALYSYLKVFGSKIQIKIMNTDNVGTAPTDIVWCTLLPTSSGQNISALFEEDVVSALPYTKKTLIHNKPLTTKSVWNLKHYMNTRRIEGITKAEFESDNYNSNTTTPLPANQWNWNVLFNTFTQANFTAADKYAIHLSITYYTKWYKRNGVPLIQ